MGDGSVKFAKNEGKTLWNSAGRNAASADPIKRDYRLLERLSPDMGNLKTDVHITQDDSELLRNFLQNRQMTMGDLVTVNNLIGSKIIASLEKLVSFGLVRRNWDKEAEMHTDVVYSLTPEGHYVATKNI